MNKLAKFFIICAIVLFVGIGMCLGGIWAGGVNGVNKVADKYDWIDGPPGKFEVAHADALEFDSIETSGEMDVCLIGTEYTGMPDSWKIPRRIIGTITAYAPEEGSVFLCYGENVTAPEYAVENGVLTIDSNYGRDGAISVNLTANDGVPKAIVFCGDRELKDITVDGNFCDVVMLGITYENANIGTSDSLVYMECVKSGNLTIDAECTEVELHGEFLGTTEVATTDADVTINTIVNKDQYGLELEAVDGDIEVDNGTVDIEDYPWTYSKKGGPNNILIKNNCGEIEIFFGDTLYR